MSVNYISNNFGHNATNEQYAKYMTMLLTRGRLYNDLYQTVAAMVDGDIYIVEQITEQYRLSDIDNIELIDAIASVSDNEYIIDIDSDTELGIEKTARNMRLWRLDDVQILDESKHSILG